MREAAGLGGRALGLMLRGGWGEEDGLWLPETRGVHTCLVRFHIDLVYVDEHLRVVRVVRALKPWRISPYVWSARHVLELPAGALPRSGTREGDYLVREGGRE